MDRKLLGQIGEAVAEDYLKRQGYKILERNYILGGGEIDIVAEKNGCIIIVEVKSIMKSPGYCPFDHISEAKKKQLRKLSHLYLAENKMGADQAVQIDIIGVELDRAGKVAKIEHCENALEDKF